MHWRGAGNQLFIAAIVSRPAEGAMARQLAAEPRSVEQQTGPEGVLGCRIVTHSGLEVWFASGPNVENRLECGPMTAVAESLLVAQNPGGQPRGVALGCKSLKFNERPVELANADFEFSLDPNGVVAQEPIRRPIDTVRILPEQNVFTERAEIAFELSAGERRDVEFRYTLDGQEPTSSSPRYTAPIAIDKTTLVKVRPFRQGLTTTPWSFGGVESGRTVGAIFRKRAPLPAIAAPRVASRPGLAYEYYEGDWPTLLSYAAYPGTLEPKAGGTLMNLFESSELERIRATDRAFALRCDGLVDIPTAGVYTLHAPTHLHTPTMDAGFDLRVFLDGEEWMPCPGLHSEHAWSIPLAAGLHRLRVAYTDYRWRTFRNDYWMAWQPEEIWQGAPCWKSPARASSGKPCRTRGCATRSTRRSKPRSLARGKWPPMTKRSSFSAGGGLFLGLLLGEGRFEHFELPFDRGAARFELGGFGLIFHGARVVALGVVAVG